MGQPVPRLLAAQEDINSIPVESSITNNKIFFIMLGFIEGIFNFASKDKNRSYRWKLNLTIKRYLSAGMLVKIMPTVFVNCICITALTGF